MDVGTLRNTIRIYDKGTITRNGTGEEIPAYDALVAEVWAAKEPLSGREFLEAQQVQADLSVRFRIRYRDDVRPEMRCVEDGHTYHISAVLDQKGEKKELHLMCTEVLA
jgi:SPP1 family predicted phage head-tail adaptor